MSVDPSPPPFPDLGRFRDAVRLRNRCRRAAMLHHERCGLAPSVVYANATYDAIADLIREDERRRGRGDAVSDPNVSGVHGPDEFRCTCDPGDLFDPPDPRPRAVAGCPAHRARRAAQQFIEQARTGC